MDSLRTTVPCTSLQELERICSDIAGLESCEFSKLEVKPYQLDERIHEDTYLVYLPGYGVVGFTDGPV